MNKPVVSPSILPPTSFYSHAVEVTAQSRTLFISGQIPVAANGACPSGFVEQAEQCWSNLIDVLHHAGMEVGDLVRIQGFVTRPVDLPLYRDIRNKALGSSRPASTLLVVAALGRPEWLVEIEAVAARH